MPKKLCARKSVETESLATLASSSKASLYENVKSQFTAIMQLPSEYNEVCNEVNRSGFSILRTAHRLDEYSKALIGYVPKLKTRELSFLLYSLCERAKPFFQKKNIILSCNLSKEKLFTQIDEESFYYAVLELLLNALEFSKPNSRVSVDLSYTKKYIKIEVKDRGCGMKEEVKLSCCDPFFTTKEGGCGLGLALVQNFAKNLGGRISVSSKEGSGTCVSLLLPKTEPSSISVGSPNIEFLSEKVSPVEIMLS